MGSFIHHDRIAERLEIARAIGLVSKYVISPIGSVARPLASVTVWPSPVVNDPTLRTYLARLLDGLVSGDNISVTPAAALGSSSDTARDQPLRAPEAVAA